VDKIGITTTEEPHGRVSLPTKQSAVKANKIDLLQPQEDRLRFLGLRLFSPFSKSWLKHWLRNQGIQGGRISLM
jgi:hypothetical protein